MLNYNQVKNTMEINRIDGNQKENDDILYAFRLLWLSDLITDEEFFLVRRIYNDSKEVKDEQSV